MQGLQVGDCLGLWGDAEAIGNAADAGRSRIPGLSRGAMAEPSLSSRSALVLQHTRPAIHLFSATGRDEVDFGTSTLLMLCIFLVQCCQALLPASCRAHTTELSKPMDTPVAPSLLWPSRGQRGDAAGGSGEKNSGPGSGQVGRGEAGHRAGISGQGLPPLGRSLLRGSHNGSADSLASSEPSACSLRPSGICSISIMAAASIWLLSRCSAWISCAAIDV